MQIAAIITTNIACNEMYELMKNTAAIEALCQTLSWANAPSCSKKIAPDVRDFISVIQNQMQERHTMKYK